MTLSTNTIDLPINQLFSDIADLLDVVNLLTEVNFNDQVFISTTTRFPGRLMAEAHNATCAEIGTDESYSVKVEFLKLDCY